VPGIFLVLGGDGRYLVLDGQQRLLTLYAFYRGILRDEAFRLHWVQEDFAGMTYDTLDPESRRRLDNSIIHATVVKQEQPSGDQSGIYKIFERLNTGGTLLQPQEIRVALYNGPLIQLVRELNADPNWRACVPKSRRLKDQELILRFFAFRTFAGDYEAPMKAFLNHYTEWNRDLREQSAEELMDVFTRVVRLVRDNFGDRAFRLVRAVNAAMVDSILMVVAEGVEAGTLKRPGQALRRGYDRLLADHDYLEAVNQATAREEQVALRIAQARAHLLK